MNCWLLLSAALLAHDSGSFIAVQAISLWMPPSPIISSLRALPLRLRGGATSDDSEEKADGRSRSGSPKRRRRKKKKVKSVNQSTTALGDDYELLQLNEGENEMDSSQTDASGVTRGETDNTAIPATKKKRRRKRRGVSQKDADRGDFIDLDRSEEIMDNIDSAETQEKLQSGDATQTSRIKKRRRRRAVQVASENSPVEEEEGEEVPEVSDSVDGQIDSKSNIQGGEDSQPSSGNLKKKRRRRRRKSEVDETPALSTDEGESSLTEITSASIAVDASIEIPSEELVPESSIGTSVEIIEDMHITPMMEEGDDAGESVNVANEAYLSLGGESDAGEPLATNSESPTSETNIEDTAKLSTSISVDTFIEIPTEEIVPESIDSSVDIEENMPIDPMEDEVTGEYMAENVEPASHEVDDQGAEQDVANEIDDQMQADLTSSVTDQEELGASTEDTIVGSDIEKEIPESIEDKERYQSHDDDQQNITDTVDTSQTHQAIDSSIDLPNEEIVPESDNVAVESEENAQMEPLEVNNGDEDTDKIAAGDEDIDTTSIVEELPNIEDTEIPSDDQILAGKDERGDAVEAQEEGGSDLTPEEDARGSDAAESPLDALTDEKSDESAVLNDNVVDKPESSDAIETSEASTQLSESFVKEDEDKTIDELETMKMDDDCLTLSMVTWNLGEVAPSEKDASFFRRFRTNSNGIGSDLVMIGAQECEEIKPRRTEGHRSRHIRRMGIMMLGKEYVPIAIHSLGGIQCALYCHRDVLGDVEMINIADVTCGVGNVFHNKGAIGVYLKMKRQDSDDSGLIKSTRMLFITGHLAAHVKNVDARNNDFRRIISELEAQAPARFLRPKRNRDGSPAECDGEHLLSSMDHVFFAGDLNYRIDLPREYVERCITNIKKCRSEEKSTTSKEAGVLMKKLLRRDQLLQTIASGRAFADFNEGNIDFLPTFKFDKGTSNYDTSAKQRVPAWTDRILFRSKKVRVLEYQSASNAKHSDHRPVFGTFQVGWGSTVKGKPKGFARKPKRNRRRQK